MWSVIRKRQSLSPNRAPVRPDTAYVANHRCIQLHEVRPNVPASDPTAFSTAYGNFVYMKVRRWMLDEREHLRLQAVEHLIECYTERRENCVTSLRYDLLPILLLALERDESAAVRERAGLALELLLRESQAQHLMLESEEMLRGSDDDSRPAKSAALRNTRPILSSLHDGSDEVVVTGLRVVMACHAWQNSFALTDVLVRGGLVPRLVELIQHPSVSVAMFACSAARQIFQAKEAHVQFLRLGGVAAVTQAILDTDAVPLIAEAADVLSLIAEYPQGRRDAVESSAVLALLPHIGSDNLTLRVALFSALAQITVLEAAKRQATELGLPPLLVHEMAGEDERDVLMHMLRLLYNLAEWPVARGVLRGCQQRIAALKALAEGDDVVVLALEQAETILNRPGPIATAVAPS